ncbi:MAG TPA: zf-HC2 domain-containing protein [Streptosporangiaceae bacterium]|nr:zf-HC2 domain-containing protein [Streptosporangiaceae bacterium]
MTGRCSWVRTSLGVYVLGAIDPAERAQVDAHLPACAMCRDEVAALAGLPALLGRISEEQIAQVADRPPALLEQLLTKAAAERPNRRRQWVSLAVAAVLVLIVGALAGALLTPGEGGSPAPPIARSSPPATSVPATPPVEERSAMDPATKVEAWVGVDDKEWGTALTVRLRGAPPGARCRMYAIAMNGRRDAAGAWQYGGREYEEFNGSTMIPRAELAEVEIVMTNGRRLITIPI